MYRKHESGGVIRLSDMAYIPPVPENNDYAEYLKWVEAGNVIEEPDEA
jgi:hypothetical protein